MSPSLLNVSNAGSKPEEFSLNDIEVVVDSEGENWFKRAHVGKFLGFAKILISVEGLATQEMPQRDDIKAMVSNPYPWSRPKDHQYKTDKFLLIFGVMYVIIKSKNPKGKALKKHILKTLYRVGLMQELKRSKESINKPSQTVTIKYKPLSLRMKNINRKF